MFSLKDSLFPPSPLLPSLTRSSTASGPHPYAAKTTAPCLELVTKSPNWPSWVEPARNFLLDHVEINQRPKIQGSEVSMKFVHLALLIPTL